MADNDINRKSQTEEAEGSRETIEQNINDEYPGGDSGAGITNRPIDEEKKNQQRVPDRGAAKDEDEPLTRVDV